MRWFFGTLIALSIHLPLQAKPRAPLANTAFDGGVLSAEALGRGRTVASNIGTPASGSENPAALNNLVPSSVYTTIFLSNSSDVPEPLIDQEDPLHRKRLNYLSIASEKGVIFFEPIGRRQETQILNPASPSTDFRELEFSANAVGFAGSQKFGKGGSYGISIAYLRGSISSTEHRSGFPDDSTLDTADGVRLNLGVRYPTGPAMWGVVLQNAPGFLWWKDFRRQILPFRFRVGNTWRIRKGVLFTLESDTRFYREGSDDETFLRVGYEMPASKHLILRAGAFSEDLDESEKRHLTGGATLKSQSGIEITYAIERFEIQGERVLKSFLSVLFPFQGEFERVE